jgi:hypothetical protein
VCAHAARRRILASNENGPGDFKPPGPCAFKVNASGYRGGSLLSVSTNEALPPATSAEYPCRIGRMPRSHSLENVGFLKVIRTFFAAHTRREGAEYANALTLASRKKFRRLL